MRNPSEIVMLDSRLKACRTLSDVLSLELDARVLGYTLESKRTAYGAHRMLFGFSSSKRDSIAAGSSTYIMDGASTRVAYLYDDSVSNGESDVKNLYRVARFVSEW